MTKKEIIVRELDNFPSELLDEVINYIGYVKYRYDVNHKKKYNNTTLASEASLAKEWLTPEEDEAWENL